MTTDAPVQHARQASPGHRVGPARLLVVLVTALSVLFYGPPAQAAPLIIPAAGAALPFSVVSAGVGGGISLVTTGVAIAGAGITAAAALAGNWAVDTLFNWGEDAPDDFGDPEPTDGTPTYPNGWAVKEVSRTLNAGGGPSSLTYDVTIGTLPPDHVNTKVARLLCNTMYEGTAFTDGVTLSGTFYVGDVVRCTTKPYENRTVTAVGMISSVNSSSTLYCTAVPLGVWPSGHACTGGPTSTGTTGGTSVEPGSTPLTVTPTTMCRHADGSTSTLHGTVVGHVRNDDASKVLTYPACPSGSTVQSRSAPITRDSDGTLLGDALTGETGTSTPWQPDLVPAEYPDCQNRLCVMTLTKTSPAGDALSCNAQPEACLSYGTVVQTWPQTGTGASTATRPDTEGNEYACKFGPYAVAVAECQVIPGVGVAPTPAEQDTRCDWQLSKPWTWPWTALRCAFEPGSGAMTQWQSRVDRMAARPPANIIVGGIDVVGEAAEDVDSCSSESPDATCAGWTIPVFLDPTGQYEVDLLASAGDRVQELWGGRLYLVVQVGIVVGGGLLVWNRISASLGAK
jgi:hypothetical protein